MAEWQKGSSIG